MKKLKLAIPYETHHVAIGTLTKILYPHECYPDVCWKKKKPVGQNLSEKAEGRVRKICCGQHRRGKVLWHFLLSLGKIWEARVTLQNAFYISNSGVASTHTHSHHTHITHPHTHTHRDIKKKTDPQNWQHQNGEDWDCNKLQNCVFGKVYDCEGMHVQATQSINPPNGELSISRIQLPGGSGSSMNPLYIATETISLGWSPEPYVFQPFCHWNQFI